MLESRFNSPTLLLSILKTTFQLLLNKGWRFYNPEVWFLKQLERLKPCFGGSFKVPGQGQANLLNMESKAILLGFIEQFKTCALSPSTSFSSSLSWMNSTRQLLQTQLHGLLLLCEAGRTGCCSPLLPSGWAQHCCCLQTQHFPEPFHPTAPGRDRLVSASPHRALLSGPQEGHSSPSPF